MTVIGDEYIPGDTTAVAPRMDPDQVPLFDLAALTVMVPGQEQREAMDAAGLTPQSRKLVYDQASIRQIVTYWQADHYVDIVRRLGAAGLKLGTSTHTDTVEKLLEHYESHPYGGNGGRAA